jgi:hypothetical protein
LTRRAAVAATLVVAAAAVAPAAFAQTPDAATRATFERFLVAPDAEALRLARRLEDLPPETLAALARPLSREHGVCKIVRAEGYDPPLACVVLTPKAPPPPEGYPVYATLVGPFAGPEEFRLRARFGALLDAGCAIVAPVETAVWLPSPTPVAETAPNRAERVATLLAAAEREAPLDPSRRVLLVGRPAGHFGFDALRSVATAFAAVHFTYVGDFIAPMAEDVLAFGPRRFVVHHGSRVSDPAEIRLRRLESLARSLGDDVVRVADPSLTYEPTAAFEAPHALAALPGLRGNRAPRVVRAAWSDARRTGGAGVLLLATGGDGSVVVEGFGDAAVDVAVVASADATFELVLPKLGASPDWEAPTAWRTSAGPAVSVTAKGGFQAEVDAPRGAREKLLAWRLAKTSGLPIEDAVVAALRRAP